MTGRASLGVQRPAIRLVGGCEPCRRQLRLQLRDDVDLVLWRIAQLNCRHGLFEVTQRIYQVRGFDIANMTIVEGETGIIVIDTLTSTEPAKAALRLYYQHRARRRIAE